MRLTARDIVLSMSQGKDEEFREGVLYMQEPRLLFVVARCGPSSERALANIDPTFTQAATRTLDMALCLALCEMA